jgi:hypothetical protein
MQYARMHRPHLVVGEHLPLEAGEVVRILPQLDFD